MNAASDSGERRASRAIAVSRSRFVTMRIPILPPDLQGSAHRSTLGTLSLLHQRVCGRPLALECAVSLRTGALSGVGSSSSAWVRRVFR